MEDFNEALFKTKVDNIFVKIHIALMSNTLDEVKHFMSDNLYSELSNYLNQLLKEGKQQMYDEINVKNTYIKRREVVADKEVVEVHLIARYMDYIIDTASGKTIAGIDTRRVEKSYNLVFEKKVSAKKLGLVRKCANCGASMNINATGKCQFCGSTFELSNYDYILVSMEKS